MSEEIRPFTIDVPDEVLDHLRRRLHATRWPDHEVVDDWSQGVPLDRGGHFAAFEVPETFVADVRACFRRAR